VRYTKVQYEKAIEHLQLRLQQLEGDALPCSICTDGGHNAYECGFNPLLAVHLCCITGKTAETLHDLVHKDGWTDEVQNRVHHFLYWLAGEQMVFGVQLGPRKMVLPHPVHGDHPYPTETPKC